MILLGDSLHVLKTLDDNSIDSVVTDPPYGLSFMGKKWDYDVPSKELWAEVLRVLKPGGHLLSFAGSRTYHRMAVNIEDAGFEIRDQIMWIYGSGFPKSHNIGKSVDKLQGNEREVVGKKTGQGDIRGKNGLNGQIQSSRPYIEVDITKGNSPYEGWGTALKPAHEPIVLARKPLKEKTVAENVLKYGTGGINIDESRVETSDKYSYPNGAGGNSFSVGEEPDGKRTEPVESNSLGRFPANLIHDGSDEVVGLFPVNNNKGHTPKLGKGNPFGGDNNNEQTESYFNDSGSAARFFYCAKAGKSERNKGLEGFEERNASKMSGGKFSNQDGTSTNNHERTRQNHHPTVKPVKLMQYLVKLVTPKDGTVLDPFNGSGTTGIACKLEGFEYIGIELDPEYVKISEARIDAWERPHTLFDNTST